MEWTIFAAAVFYVIAIPATVMLLSHRRYCFSGIHEDSGADADAGADDIPDDLADGDAALDLTRPESFGRGCRLSAAFHGARHYIVFVVTGWCG